MGLGIFFNLYILSNRPFSIIGKERKTVTFETYYSKIIRTVTWKCLKKHMILIALFKQISSKIIFLLLKSLTFKHTLDKGNKL